MPVDLRMDVIFANKSKLFYFDLNRKVLTNKKPNTELEERNVLTRTETRLRDSDILNYIRLL